MRVGNKIVVSLCQSSVSSLICNRNNKQFIHAVNVYPPCNVISATVKDVANDPILLDQRRKQLEQRRELYQWKMYPEKQLPSYIDSSVEHLPPDEKFQRVKNFDFTEDALKAVVTLGVHYVTESCDSLHEYEEWAKYLGHPEVPVYVASRWEMDVEFGRQMLNGVNPVVIEKCHPRPRDDQKVSSGTSLPPTFPVTNEMVKGFLNGGHTLEHEMEVGDVMNCLASFVCLQSCDDCVVTLVSRLHSTINLDWHTHSICTHM